MKNKLLLFEPLAAGEAGHGLDNLLEDAEVFKKNYKIIAFVNKNFNKNIITPTFIELFKICETNNKGRTFNLLPFIKNFNALESRSVVLNIRRMADHQKIMPTFLRPTLFF